MNTRRSQEGDPISFEKYMSSPEYVELRGIDGIAAAAKAGILMDARKRGLLFFLQAMSLRPGGVKKLGADLIAKFPERLGTPTMHKLGIKPHAAYSEGDAR